MVLSAYDIIVLRLNSENIILSKEQNEKIERISDRIYSLTEKESCSGYSVDYDNDTGIFDIGIIFSEPSISIRSDNPFWSAMDDLCGLEIEPLGNPDEDPESCVKIKCSFIL